MLATALHLPPAFSHSTRVVCCAIVSLEPVEPDTPVDGLADGVDAPLRSVLELLVGAEAPVLVLESVPDVPLDVPAAPDVPLLPAAPDVLSELPVPLLPAAPLLPAPLEPEPAAPPAPAAPLPLPPPAPPPA